VLESRSLQRGLSSTRVRWLAAWPGGALIGVANGIMRERTYGRHVNEAPAHQISSLTAIIAFAGSFLGLQRVWPIDSRREARQIGAGWLALTIGFEVGFGRLVAKQSWRVLLADYDVRAGRTWPVVLAWLAVGPSIVRRWGSSPHRA
jgi:hypothetical protein